MSASALRDLVRNGRGRDLLLEVVLEVRAPPHHDGRHVPTAVGEASNRPHNVAESRRTDEHHADRVAHFGSTEREHVAIPYLESTERNFELAVTRTSCEEIHRSREIALIILMETESAT